MKEGRTELLGGILEVSKDDVERGLEIHRRAVVVDGAAEAPVIWSEEMRRKALSLIEKGGNYDSILSANFAAVLKYFDGVDPEYRKEWTDAIRHPGVSSITVTVDHPSLWENVAYWMYRFDHHGDVLTKYTCADDIAKAKAEGKVVVLWYAQHHADYIGRHLDQWDTLARMGIKLAHIAHNQRNFYGDGGQERADSGLSSAGIAAVEKLNDLGILIDTSHTGQQTTFECAKYSKDPIASIHTGCRDLHDHVHNKYDRVLKAIAEGGGVAGMYVNFLSAKGPGTLVDWLDHVDHAVNVMGVDHVGVGTETATVRDEPPEIVRLHDDWYRLPIHGVKKEDDTYTAIVSSQDADRSEVLRVRWNDWANLTIGLVSRGYSDEDVEKIIGGNWLRLYRAVLDKKRG